MTADKGRTNNGMHAITPVQPPNTSASAAVAAAAVVKPAAAAGEAKKSIAEIMYPERVGLRGRPIAKPEEKKP